MASKDGFLPCTLDESVGPVLPKWEKSVVVTALAVHSADVVLDILVLLLFFTNGQWGFFVGSAGVILSAWIVSGLYVSFGSGGGGPSEGSNDRLVNFTQIQVFTEAYRCIFQGEETDFFHTLRLLEALLESAPNALVQLYALIIWAGTSAAPDHAPALLRLSIFASFCSVGLGLAMWEQKVQFRASCGYVASVALLRGFEVASRTLTLAIFAGLTHPYGLIWVLVIDYVVMVLIIARHKSVDFSYGFFVALPLLLVSLEPFVWRRADHAVPKDSFYAVRVVESILMWMFITNQQNTIDRQATHPIWISSELLALLTTLGLYCLLPFVWRAARRQELSRDVDDWGDDTGEDSFSGSDGSYNSGNDEEQRSLVNSAVVANPGELPAE